MPTKFDDHEGQTIHVYRVSSPSWSYCSDSSALHHVSRWDYDGTSDFDRNDEQAWKTTTRLGIQKRKSYYIALLHFGERRQNYSHIIQKHR